MVGKKKKKRRIYSSLSEKMKNMTRVQLGCKHKRGGGRVVVVVGGDGKLETRDESQGGA